MIEKIYNSTPMHDIGKVGIPDRILLKPERSEPAEFEIMRTHMTLGRDAIQAAENSLGLQVDFLSIANEIAYGHQEKWDCSGYPEGLKWESIPISARLIAVADRIRRPDKSPCLQRQHVPRQGNIHH
jgi:putative two-component system response regulator